LLIVCFLTGIILSVRCARGTIDDFKIWKQSKLKISPQVQCKVDKGFQGILKLFANAQAPFTASKHKPLTSEQKRFNRQLAKERSLTITRQSGLQDIPNVQRTISRKTQKL